MSAHPSLITVCKTLINSLFPQNHSRFLSISDGTLFAPISDVSQRFRSIRITTIDASGPIVHLHLDLPRQTILFIRNLFRQISSGLVPRRLCSDSQGDGPGDVSSLGSRAVYSTVSDLVFKLFISRTNKVDQLYVNLLMC